MKDTFALAVFVLLFAWFVFYLPDYLGHADNYIEANPLSTPPHIVPEWYFLPYYAILRAIPNKLLGVIAMFSSIILLCFAPWLDTSRVRSAKYRPVYKWFFWLFIFTVVALGYLGSKPAEGTYVMWARIFTAYYFMHFLIVMPIVGVMETPTPLAAIHHRVGAGQQVRAAGRRRPAKALERGNAMSTMHRAKTGLAALLLRLALAAGTGPAVAAAAEGGHVAIERQKWTFGGLFGKFDDAQLQRGFRVYMEVCARCHGLSRIHFRNLAEPGGPGFPEAAVKSLAATFQYDDAPNDQGKIVKRPGLLTDRLPSPYKNEQEARYAQNGALPPDLSLIAKARAAESDTPFYRVPDKMLRDIATGYQEGGAGLRLRLPDRLRGAAGRHEDGRLHELQQGLPRPPDRHAQSVPGRRRPRQVRRRHARRRSTTTRAT